MSSEFATNDFGIAKVENVLGFCKLILTNFFTVKFNGFTITKPNHDPHANCAYSRGYGSVGSKIDN